MKLYQLSILQVVNDNATALVTTSDLSSFSFYQRGSVGEFMTFMAKTVAERTKAGQRQTVHENSYTAHVYNAGRDDLAGKHRTSRHQEELTHAVRIPSCCDHR
jgi:synaptobrevin homolog YKT6